MSTRCQYCFQDAQTQTSHVFVVWPPTISPTTKSPTYSRVYYYICESQECKDKRQRAIDRDNTNRATLRERDQDDRMELSPNADYDLFAYDVGFFYEPCLSQPRCQVK